MPRTADHIVETHRLATTRRAAGKPIWAHKLDVSDVFHNEAIAFEERRDAIVRRLHATAWVQDSYTLTELVDELADSKDEDEFNGPWDAIYDEADYDRVWIKTS